jgi:hypothetical protein
MSSVEADGILRLMEAEHLQNRGDIKALQEGQALLTKTMTSLVGEISGAARVLKFLGWLAVAVIMGLGVWFASLEARGKVSDNRPPSAVSLQKAPEHGSVDTTTGH